MSRTDLRPYFLWDEAVTISQLREVVRVGPDHPDYLRLVGKMLREARDTDVWFFVRPDQVADLLPVLSKRLGRRAAFWTFLIDGWRQDGLLAA